LRRRPPASSWRNAIIAIPRVGAASRRSWCSRRGSRRCATRSSLTLFALDAGQALSEHTTAFDAYLQVLDGEADLVVGGTGVLARAGEVALLPAGVPHEVNARVRCKMLLTMVRPELRTA